MARRAGRSRSIRERLSDPGGELAPSVGSRIAAGCGVGCVALVLLGGALGIAFGARERLASWGGDDETEIDSPNGDIDEEPYDPDGEDPPAPPDPGDRDPREDMRRRYRAGPFVRIESMVPSGRLLPPVTSTGVIHGRTIDNPWIVPGSELRAGTTPGAAPGGPTISHDPNEPSSRPLTVLPRTPARALVRARDASGGTSIAGYLVEFVGYEGHFYLPATIPTELGVVSAGGSDGANIQFAIHAPIRPDGTSLASGQSFDVTMRIGAIDDAGRVSSLIVRQLNVLSVGAGDVEVTLTMGEPTDLDLYVIDPAGTTIYYANTNSSSGGRLDLDANAACSGNLGVNNEHIFWPAGNAPAGTYRVNVAHYRSCIQNRPVSIRVTVSACGETVVVSGNFSGSARSGQCTAPTQADRSWCQNIITFDVPPCSR